MKTIYILLTRSTTIVSRVVYFVTRDTYTHVSISFEQELQPLYSSGRKNGSTIFPAGPCVEYFHRGYLKKHSDIPCAVYKLEVSDEAYYRAKKEVEKVMKKADEYHFNILGLFLCHLNIKFQRERKFFCSQFVSEVLKRSYAVELPKDPTLMKPSDYMELPQLLCCFRGYIRELQDGRIYEAYR